MADRTDSRLYLDTNCLLRLVLQDLPEQVRLVEKVLKENKVVYIADAAIIEMVYVLEKQYDLSRPLVADGVMFFTSTKKFRCNSKVLHAAALDYASPPKISFTDCYLAHVADAKASWLITFDKKLKRKFSQSVKVPE